jgi:hypothetical protein
MLIIKKTNSSNDKAIPLNVLRSFLSDVTNGTFILIKKKYSH